MAKPFDQIFDSFSSAMTLLRGPDFQHLLEHYERAKPAFLVGYEVQDEVSADVLFEAAGKFNLKPEGYLAAFAEFVKEKSAEIEAIAILLNKPKAWNTQALNDLKKKLHENNFAEADLQKAHRIVYHKDLVDIVSMVKHAARDSEPLLSPEERVNKAIEKVSAGKDFSPEQTQWLDYIREHLKQNMTIDEQDLQDLPVFADRGGLAKFKRIFPDVHLALLNELNEAVAA